LERESRLWSWTRSTVHKEPKILAMLASRLPQLHNKESQITSNTDPSIFHPHRQQRSLAKSKTVSNAISRLFTPSKQTKQARNKINHNGKPLSQKKHVSKVTLQTATKPPPESHLNPLTTAKPLHTDKPRFWPSTF